MKNRFVGICFSALAAAGLANAPATAAERYIVGVENIVYMPVYGVVDGEYAGFTRALLDTFARDAGVEFDYQPLPVQRLYATFLGGGVDFKFPDSPVWRADAKKGYDVAYSAPVLTYVDATVVVPENLSASPDDIRSIGTVTGFTLAPEWAELVKQGKVRVIENGDFEALVRQVLSARVDAGFASVAVVNQRLDTSLGQPGGLVPAPKLPSMYGQYQLSTIKHPALLTRFNQWLADNADRVAALKEQYGAEKGVAR